MNFFIKEAKYKDYGEGGEEEEQQTPLFSVAACRTTSTRTACLYSGSQAGTGESHHALAWNKGLGGKEVSISELRIKAVSECKFTFPLSNHYVFTSIGTQ